MADEKAKIAPTQNVANVDPGRPFPRQYFPHTCIVPPTRSGAKNNVFLECGSNPSNNTFGWYVAPPELPDLDCDNNYVAGTGFAPKRSDLKRSVFRFVENHGINGGNPGFVSIASDNFQVLPGSKLIDAGQIIPSFTIDYAGNSRTNGASYDVGAYQFAGERSLRLGKPIPPRNFEVIK